jgi:lipoprotein-releasing system permease protein
LNNEETVNDLPFELFVAVRYLPARRRQAFISLISLISAVGVAVGVMALLIVLALMTGLQGELRDRIIGSAAHVYVLKAGGLGGADEEVRKVRAVPRVVAAAPVVLGLGLAKSVGGSQFITLKGVDPSLELGVTNVGRSMLSGSLDALTPVEGSMAGIILGKDLAQKLGVSLGHGVEVLTPEGTLTPFGVSARQRAFKVVGVFGLGLFEYDSSYGFVHLSVAERLFDRSHADLIEVKVDDLFAAQEVAEGIQARLGPDYEAQDWADMNKSVFSALWLEKMAMSITIGLIVIVAALNIIASLVLLVMEKTRDIAILKTMGSSAASIRRIFMLQGLVIGTVGTIAGAAGGCALIYILDHYQLISVPLDVSEISHVPFRLLPLDFAVVVVSAILVCFVATIYPSRQAAKLDPAQALRYQ